MSQLPILRTHDPVTRLGWISLVCGAGWLSTGVGLATAHVSWMHLSLLTVAVPLSVAALALLLSMARGFKPASGAQGEWRDPDLHESERNLRLVLNRIPAFVHTVTPT